MSKTGVYVVTGAGSGIGQALALLIARHGGHVYGLGRDPKKLAATSEMCPHGHFTSSSVDLSLAKDCLSAVQAIRQWLERTQLPLLGLVNNAGVFARSLFAESSDELWEQQFHNNLLSAVRLTRELLPLLTVHAPSSIVNISSTLGLRPIAHTLAYSAMKAAMINWTQGLALELARSRIRVNVISPGLVDTPIHGFHNLPENDVARASAHKAQPLGRLGQPLDIAEATWFLLSEKSSWTTGANFIVDGGINL